MQEIFLMEEKRVLRHLKKVFFPMSKEVLHRNKIGKQAEEKEKKRNNYLKKFSKELNRLETGYVDREVIYEYFGCRMPTEMASKLIRSNKEDNINLMASFQENLNKLIEDYHNTPDENVKKEELKKMKCTTEKILDFMNNIKKHED